MINTEVPTDLPKFDSARATSNHKARRSISDEIFDFGQPVRRVQRQEHYAGTQATEIKKDGFCAFLNLYGNTIARPQTQGSERIRYTRRGVEGLAISYGSPPALPDKHGTPIQVLPVEKRIEVHADVP
jgi:hypothetical protein